jgi:hypothetical protein
MPPEEYKYTVVRNKAYNAPFWVMLVISLILTIAYIVLFIATFNIMQQGRYRRINYNYWFMLWPVLLWAETITYRVIRKKIKKLSYVWLHIGLLGFIFIIMPVLFIIIPAFFAATESNSGYFTMLTLFEKIRYMVFWVGLAAGHAFFIATVIKSFSKTGAGEGNNEQATGILDGIIDED